MQAVHFVGNLELTADLYLFVTNSKLKHLILFQIPAEKVPRPALAKVLAQTIAVHDVASILQRRKFLIGDISDGSSASESGSDWGDNDSWN